MIRFGHRGRGKIAHADYFEFTGKCHTYAYTYFYRPKQMRYIVLYILLFRVKRIILYW